MDAYRAIHLMIRVTACLNIVLLAAACSTGKTQGTFETTSAPAPMPEVTVPPVPEPAAPQQPQQRQQITYTSVPIDGPYVAMTFDDGPHGTLTPELLDILKQRGIRATFYVIGQLVREYPHIMQRIIADGHEIGNHSWSHPNLQRMSDSSVRDQLARTETAIKETTGVRPVTMRPPYGALSQRQRQWVHGEFGYKIVMWSVDPLDWKKPGASVVANRIVGAAKNGAIILAHDIHPQTVRAMPETLDRLRAKGFQFVTVSELLAMQKSVAPQQSVAGPSPLTGSGTPVVELTPHPATE
jgi:peptidoglycan-N-acetylglucosamine deacetylase